MLTLDEMIAHEAGLADSAKRRGYEKTMERHNQIVKCLIELRERRKAPKIVRCGECKWYGRANKQRFYRGMDCLQRRISTIVPDKDFCSRAERKDGETDG